MELSIDDYLNFNIWCSFRPGYFDNYIENLKTKDYKKHIYWCHDEFEFWRPGTEEKWAQMLEIYKSKNIKPTVVTGAFKYYYDIPGLEQVNLVHWPAYYFMKTFFDVCVDQSPNRGRPNYTITNPENLNYKYHFICLNKRVRDFRCEIMDLLAKDDLLDNNAVSWFYPEVDPNRYKFIWWKPKLLQLDESFLETSDQGRVPDQYYESFAQLIPEADADRSLFPTEKTITALLLGKPFLSAGPFQFHRALLDLGFQLYDEIFDYRFDEETNRYKRWVMLVDNFKRLQKIPLNELNDIALILKPKLLHNMNRAKDIALSVNTQTPDIVKETYQIFLKTGVWMDEFAIPLLHTAHTYINKRSYEQIQI